MNQQLPNLPTTDKRSLNGRRIASLKRQPLIYRMDGMASVGEPVSVIQQSQSVRLRRDRASR
jgi:hypothetical protein